MRHHAVFGHFKGFEGFVPEGFEVDFIGAMTDHRYLSGASAHGGAIVRLAEPAFDEEYFEWIDILEAVASARNRFTMFELGAGYGRWSVRAAVAARQRGIEAIRLVAVEAEPQHADWLREHFSRNRIREGDEGEIVEAVVSGEAGEVHFYVGMPTDAKATAANSWYGQSKAKTHERAGAPLQATRAAVDGSASVETYYGKDVIEFASGWKAIGVQQLAFAPMLKEHELIDLIDLDVQGEEYNVLSSVMSELDLRVKRVHIGTHGHNLEDDLVVIFEEHGWHCLRDFACHSINPTSYGDISFVDGVQSWINPRLVNVSDGNPPEGHASRPGRRIRRQLDNRRQAAEWSGPLEKRVNALTEEIRLKDLVIRDRDHSIQRLQHLYAALLRQRLVEFGIDCSDVPGQDRENY